MRDSLQISLQQQESINENLNLEISNFQKELVKLHTQLSAKECELEQLLQKPSANDQEHQLKVSFVFVVEIGVLGTFGAKDSIEVVDCATVRAGK